VRRRLLAPLAALPLVIYVASTFNAHYGYFIDEFYYIACAKRLAFGYVDHPPLAPLVLAATRAILGDSLLAIRLPAFLAASATIWITGLLVARLGGGPFAAALAAIATGFAPVLLAVGGFFSMNAFEPLLWTLIILLLVRTIQTGESRLWLVIGLLAGLAFENKHTILVYLGALGVGLMLTPARRVLANRWCWMGAAVAAVVALPNVIWQVASGWPSLEFYRNAQLLKNQPAPPLQSLVDQVLSMGPLSLPIWLTGLGALLFAGAFRPLRFLGLTYVLLLVAHVVSQTSRPDRLSAAYPMLLAAGAVAIERGIGTRAAGAPGLARTARVVVPAVVLAAGLALSPLVLPGLSPPATARFVSALGLNLASGERGKSAPIPQLLADRTAWDTFVDEVQRVYLTLPEADRAETVIYGPSYGHFGALELLGPARGLPAGIISGHNTTWHWSLGRTDSRVFIGIDADPDTLRQLFDEVWEAGRVQCDYCMNWRSDMPIWIARGPKTPVSAVWARYRHYE
jgi:hypothetical protein